jgi:hypothetical protein
VEHRRIVGQIVIHDLAERRHGETMELESVSAGEVGDNPPGAAVAITLTVVPGTYAGLPRPDSQQMGNAK